MNLSVLAMYHRNRLTPITLARKNPLTEVIIYGSLSNTLLLQFCSNCLLCFFNSETGELFGIHQLTAFAKVLTLFKSFLRHIRAINYLNHGDIVCDCILKVTLVMGRYCHNSTGSVACQYKITDIQRYFLAIYRIDCIQSLQRTTGLGFVQLGTVHIVLLQSLIDISLYFFFILYSGHQILYNLSIGSKHHKGNTVNGLNTCGINGEFTSTYDFEFNFYTFRFTNPMSLDILGRLGPVNLLQAFQQLLCKGGLVNYPLLHIFTDNGITATLGFTVNYLIIGKNGTQLFTPVYRHIHIFCITIQIKLFKNPLCPFIKFRITGSNHLAPVIIKAQFLQLCGESLNILLGKSIGMIAGTYRILFCRQTERIVSHGMQYIVSLHTLHT